jgi:hypothetical protein
MIVVVSAVVAIAVLSAAGVGYLVYSCGATARYLASR